MIVLLPRPSRTREPDPAAAAAVARAVAQAQVPPPAYLRPAKIVGGVVKTSTGHPLELRACACCRQTFWARTNGPSPALFCSHRCYDESGGRWSRRQAA